MVFIEAETALANAKTIPTEAPNSAPRVRDMMKYIPPIITLTYTSLNLKHYQNYTVIIQFEFPQSEGHGTVLQNEKENKRKMLAAIQI